MALVCMKDESNRVIAEQQTPWQSDASTNRGVRLSFFSPESLSFLYNDLYALCMLPIAIQLP